MSGEWSEDKCLAKFLEKFDTPNEADGTVAELHSRVDFYEEANDAISLDSEEEELLYLKGRMRAQQAAQQCRVNSVIF